MGARISRLVAAVALFSTPVLMPGAAWGDGHAFEGEGTENGAGFNGSWTDDFGTDGDSGAGGSTSAGSPTPTGPVHWTQNRYVIACSINGPENPDDVMCTGATQCPEKGELRYRIYQRAMIDNRPQGSWEYVGTACRGSDEMEPAETPEITVDVVLDNAEALAPASTVHVEPATTSYVKVPNNFWAETRGSSETVVLFEGLPFETSIPVRFEPSAYVWDFGDGETAEGAGIEGAEPGQAGAVEYAYRAQGEYEITLTREFEATFTLPGQGAQTVGGISTTSPPHVLRIGEIQTTVDDVG